MNTIIPTNFTAGVRRLKTLGGYHGVMGQLGADQSAIDDLVNNGYDPSTVNTLVAKGATTQQLQNLPFPATSAEMTDAVIQLMNQLGGAIPAPGGSAASAGSYPQSAMPVSNPFTGGVLDLLQESSWDYINSLFVGASQRLNAVASKNPRDPDIVSMVTEFNSNVAQWANYYQQGVGRAPSPGSQVTLGIAPLIIAGVLSAVGALIAWLYGFVTGKIAEKERSQAALLTAQSTASTQIQLSTALADAQKRGDTATVNAILATMQRVGVPPTQPPAGITDWLQQNAGTFMTLIVVVAIGVPLIKKL